MQIRGQKQRQRGWKLYSWHTPETEALTGRKIERAYVNKGYAGHDAPKPLRVFRSGQKHGVHGQIKKELRRRSAIKAVIGHCRTDRHLGWNFLKGRDGDNFNAVMSAVGYNLRLILKWLRKLLRKIIAVLWAAILAKSALKPASQPSTTFMKQVQACWFWFWDIAARIA